MISVDFSLAISLYIISVLLSLGVGWLFSRREKDRDLSLDPKFIWFCSVCSYTYVDTKEELITVCPRCGSYNKRGDGSS